MADIRFQNVTVDIFKVGPPSLVLIDWLFKPTALPLSRYDIRIYRGESPEEMEIIAGPFPADEVTKFEDLTSRLISKYRTYYYEVTSTNRNTDVVTKSGPYTKEGFIDLVGIYIVEEHDFLFRHVCGVPLYILKKQTAGEARCTNCWDKTLKRVKRSNCQECHGTGFVGKGVGGYFDPFYTWGDIAPDPEVIQITQWGKVEQGQTDLFFTNYPRLSVGDLVFELMTGKRWKVAMVRDTEKRRVKMLQIVRLDQINNDQVEYKIQIPPEIITKARSEYDETKKEPEF